MPTITKTFAYTGTTQQATIPAGAASVTFHIWGGGGFDLRHDVLAVDKEGLIGGTTEGDVEDRSIFGEIDLFATEHPVAEFFYLSFFEELAEKVKSF